MSELDDIKADLLGNFLRIVDALDERDRPAYAEVCQCGAEMVINRCVPPAERKRMVANFLGRHNHRPDPKDTRDE